MKRLCFISILGEPGTYDASVYDTLPERDDDAAWFVRDFGDLAGVDIMTRTLTRGDLLPNVHDADMFVLGGSYNSVHDDFPWQRAILNWFPALRAASRPLLAICGGHQLLGKFYGAPVVRLDSAPAAGTQPVPLNQAGKASPLFTGVGDPPRFHFANDEHISVIPKQATLLAQTPTIPAAALDYGERWFSTQFHPEACAETLSISWSKSRPDLVHAYDDDGHGVQVIENFIELAKAG